MRQSEKASLIEDFRLGSGITAIIGLAIFVGVGLVMMLS
jgi:hypothetical protein